MSYVPVDMHGGPSIYANFTPGDVASTIIGATVDAYNFGVKHKLWGDGTYIGGRKRSRKRHRNNDECVNYSIHYSTHTSSHEVINDEDITDENGVRHYKSDTTEIEGPIEKHFDGFGNLVSMYDAENDIERIYNQGILNIEKNYKTGYTSFFDENGSILYKVHDLDEEDDDDDDYDEESDDYEDNEEEFDEDEEDESYDKKLFSSLLINHITFMNKQGYTLSKISMDDDNDQSAELIFDNNDTGDHRVCGVSLH